jgi:biotin transport system substrate-specific component
LRITERQKLQSDSVFTVTKGTPLMSLFSTSPLRLTSPALGSRSRSVDLLWSAGLALAGSLLVAACAHIAVPLPFTPVPFTLQPFAVILVGMLLGPELGFAALAAYLAEGAAGLPVFTPAGLPGVARLLGPTAGYLFAYPVAAAIAGTVPRLLPGMKRFASLACGGAVAMLVIYLSGALWFSHALHLPVGATLAGAVLPFAPSDAIKVCAAAGIAAAIQKNR